MGLQGGTYDGWGQKSFLSDLCAPAAQRSSPAGVSRRCHSRSAGPATYVSADHPRTASIPDDATPSNASDPSQAASVEGDCHRERPACRIRELVENLPDLAVLVEPLLIVRRVIREQLGILHRRLLVIVRDDDVCRRLMTIPGVGPVVALTYRVTVDVPARFRNSKAVGAVLGLTPSKYQSGQNDRTGAISRCGDEMMRMMLYEAAQSMLVRSTKWSWLKAWAMKVARHRGMKKAIVALARRLAVIMHRVWVDGTEFRWTREVAAA